MRYAGGRSDPGEDPCDLYNECDMAKAAKIYKLAADAGHAGAQCNYGWMLIHDQVPDGNK